MASPRVLSPQVMVPASRQQARRGRYPSNPFNLIYRPFEIQPCMLHPVLPGESLKSALWQCQTWTDPLISNSKNTGWTLEGFLFYVPWECLPGWDAATDGIGKDMRDMMVSAESLAAHQDANGNTWTYCPPGGVDYVLEALKRTVECYFRDEGEAWDKQLSSGSVPMAKLKGRGSRDVLDKLTLASAYADRRQDLDFDGDATATVDDMLLAMLEAGAKAQGDFLDMDYADWVRAAGGRVRQGAIDPDRDSYHEPELLAEFREFTYPTNTVEPSTGVPAVAAGWRTVKQLKKAFRFPTWGWILGLMVARPKVYYKNQEGLFAAMMQTRDAWFPPNLDGRQYEPHLLIDDLVGPLAATATEDYYVDLRDLLNYGEQFINYTPAAASAPVATLPEADGDRHYPTAADAMAVFSDTTNGRIRSDGVISLQIAGQAIVKEHVPNLTLGKS